MWLTDGLKALNEADSLRAELIEANGLMRIAYEIIAEQQDIIAAQATLLMISLDHPVYQPTPVIEVVRDEP